MNEECLICKAPLEYLDADEEMECVLCHKKQYSKTRCVSCHHRSGQIHERKITYRYEAERCDLHSLALEQSMQTGKMSFPQKLYRVLNSNFTM